MNFLVIGSGGREHAICYSFSKSEKVTKLFCANGNAGIAQIAECVDIKPTDINALVEFALQQKIELTFVGGETSLSLGIVDEFKKRGLKIIGPSKAATQLEASKAFAKDFMARHGIPTAKYVTAHSAGFALLELESGDFGDESTSVVVKADGLASGKGVVVAKNRAEALAAINEMEGLVGADAAEKIVLEECLIGREISLLMFADGENFALMPPVRDHKRIGEGDTGPNTGGMGTITDASLLTDEQITEIIEKIIRPTLHGCIKEDFPYCGVLFLGLMMTTDGPKVLEYNVRFGDPETQAILVRLKTDLVDICEAMLNGTLADLQIEWQLGSSACVVLAAKGYPQKFQTGDVIKGIEVAAAHENVTIFHAGTMLESGSKSSPLYQGEVDAPGERSGSFIYLTSGGRVLGVTATGDDLATALDRAYEAVNDISWDGMQFRKDIGK